MKKLLLTIVMFVMSIAAHAQVRYMCRNANVYFNADGPTEKIEAKNGQGASVLDAKTGNMEFMVTLKAFEFEKALMQEHFNENYVESDKFPKAVFKGVIQDFAKINLAKNGNYPVKVAGKLTLHGVTNDVVTDGIIDVKDGVVTAKSKFNIKCSDFKIEIPSLVKEKVSNTVTITVTAPYKQM